MITMASKKKIQLNKNKLLSLMRNKIVSHIHISTSEENKIILISDGDIIIPKTITINLIMFDNLLSSSILLG